MYTITCPCSYKIEVSPTQCGNHTECPSCGESILVRSFSQLKRDAGNPVSLISDADRLNVAVSRGEPPFDGQCQVCSTAIASWLLPTHLTFLDQRVLTGSEVTLSGASVLVGYAPSIENWQSVAIPCYFCDACATSFRRAWKRDWRARFISKSINLVWIIPLCLMAIAVIALLPFVGWTFGVFLIYAIYRHWTRKKGDKFLESHIKRLETAKKLLEEDEYFLSHEPFRKIP